MFKRNFPTRGFALGGIIASLSLFSANARASTAPFTFAQFVEAGTVGATTQPSSVSNNFAYIDGGSGGDAELTTTDGATTGVSIPVIFTYLAIAGTLPSDLQGPQAAMLTLTSSSKQTVQTVTAFGDTIAHQQVFGDGSAPDVLTITRDTAAAEGNGSKDILLQMTFTGGLLGILGQTTPSLSGNTSNGDTVTYSSDFATFGSKSVNDFNMAFSSWTTDAGSTPGLAIDSSDSYFSSATAAATTTFDSNIAPVGTSVPEPASGVMILSLLSIPLAGRAKRRRAC